MLLGAWGNAFPYGIFSHLEWVSNTGYKYLNFHYNPAHMIAVSFFFATTLRPVAARLADPVGRQSGQGRDGEDARARGHLLPRPHGLFDRHARHPPRWASSWRSPPAFWSAICIVISGPVWSQGWPEWWNWWRNLPIWSAK